MNFIKEYPSSNNTVTKVTSEHLHITFCNCGNQLDHLNYGGYDFCKSKGFDCKKCKKPCTGLNGEYETGYEDKTVHGYCKKCNAKIEF